MFGVFLLLRSTVVPVQTELASTSFVYLCVVSIWLSSSGSTIGTITTACWDIPQDMTKIKSFLKCTFMIITEVS
ncbi:hypothetical protein DFH28DRAFT_947114 [Melampsora americana]|nr:hypothetical protein DFH28DRAFT_947114 [Melampsora americana]